MSTDKRVTKDLIETLEDGRKGFDHAADRLADSDRPDLGTKFRQYASQRAAFSAELETMAAMYGDDIDESGSVAGTVHRGWISFMDMITGADPAAILDAAEQGEDHAVAEFEKALEEDISDDLRMTVQRQLTDIRRAHDEIRSVRNTVG